MLDSILLELLDPEIRFSEIKNSVLGHEVQGFIYEKPFDHHRIAYLLDILLHLVRFGGLNFNRVTSATIVDHSPTPEFVERLGHRKLHTRILRLIIESNQPSWLCRKIIYVCAY